MPGSVYSDDGLLSDGERDSDVSLEDLSRLDQHGRADFPEEKTQLKRGLHQRHIQMIALAGTIGTGLFLSSGKAIAQAGPLGAWLGYSLMGLLVMGPVFSVAEMSALVPLNGGIVRHAEHFVDPALSFANGWNSVFQHMVSLPADMVGAAVIVEYWAPINNGFSITIFGLLVILSNVILVRIYGELEFAFGLLKIMLVAGLNIMAIIVVCGGGPDHHAYGFQYWRSPGLFVEYLGIEGGLGHFLGFWTVLSNAVYAYAGVENISLAAAETKSPRRNIPIAAERIFWRVALFYSLTLFMIGLIVPSDDPNLLRSEGTAAQSPFVIAAIRAGIKTVPSLINAIVLTSAWSAGNAGLLNGSRTLYGLACESRAPKTFTRTSRFGVPYVSVLFLSAFICLGYTTLDSSAVRVFTWLQDLVAISALVNWTIICGVYLRFYYGMKRQGISRDRLPWKGPGQPYTAWVGLIVFVILLLTGGYTTFLHGHWDTELFISSYINIPFVLLLYFGFKRVKNSKFLPLEEIPIMKFIKIADTDADADDEQDAKPVTGWRRWNVLWN